jgi:hypothetical protein
MKTSAIVAKSVSRLFLLLLLMAIVPLFKADSTKLQHLYITAGHKWLFIFPAILVISFVYFFVRCTIKRYSETDSNWLLVISTVILMAYCATIFMKVYQLTM